MEAGIIFIALIFGLIIRLIAGSFDSDRIENYIKAQGGKMISKTWQPFGKGWAGEKNDRIYQVIYLDKDGNRHEAFVKTSSFSGVYFTEDRIIAYNTNNQKLAANKPSTIERLELENERLKREIEALKRKNNK